LQQAVAEGQFREDLFYRLNVVPLQLPPLRERKEDIPGLVEHFRQKYNARLGRTVEQFTPEALAVLAQHQWPGNIRELENIVERTLLFAESTVIDAADLPADLLAQSRATVLAKTAPQTLATDGSLKEIVRHATVEIERDLIAQALQRLDGNVTHASQALKISRKSLQLKMKEFGLRDNTEAVNISAT